MARQMKKFHQTSSEGRKNLGGNEKDVDNGEGNTSDLGRKKEVSRQPRTDRVVTNDDYQGRGYSYRGHEGDNENKRR